jgi:hypothetical protein
LYTYLQSDELSARYTNFSVSPRLAGVTLSRYARGEGLYCTVNKSDFKAILRLDAVHDLMLLFRDHLCS